jgi:hypothetical protein
MNPRKLLDWRKLLIYSHRWLGIALSLVFVCWFVSGILFVYWDEPHLTAQERLARMRPLDLSTVRITPAEAAQSLEISPIGRLRIAMLRDRPVYGDCPILRAERTRPGATARRTLLHFLSAAGT